MHAQLPLLMVHGTWCGTTITSIGTWHVLLRANRVVPSIAGSALHTYRVDFLKHTVYLNKGVATIMYLHIPLQYNTRVELLERGGYRCAIIHPAWGGGYM